MSITVKVKKLHEDAVIPAKAYVNDAGFDLCALETTVIEPGQTVVIKTGLAFEIPDGYEMQVRPRSGVSIRTKLHVILGTVDSQYRGEVGIIVHNAQQVEYYSAPRMMMPILAGDNDFNTVNARRTGIAINKGDRIAQAVIQEIPHVTLYEVDELSDSHRGQNGFGSTGV